MRVGEWLAAHHDLDRFDRDLLLCAATGLSRARLLTHPEQPLDAEALAALDAWVDRRRRGEPVAYLLGRQGFRDFELDVSSDVLIPRPETELLVEQVLAALPTVGQDQPRVLDLGTGSGAIAIAVALAAPHAQVTGVDVSAAALQVAAGNARRLEATVAWLQSDWYAAVAGSFDIIVSNPPYVAEHDPHLDALAFEPRLALVGGEDGLDALRTIIAGAAARLRPGQGPRSDGQPGAQGWLMLEHGYDQSAAVVELLSASGFDQVTTVRDLAGHLRVAVAQRAA
ncbi:MAG: peptide chain release factor N(5)-glutamine methyltransferase [Gammaproteobacteria bacterium]